MAVFLSPVGGVAAQFFNNDGVPLAGGLIYTYAAGTSTPATTYTDSSGMIQHSNPIVLDSAGRVPGGEIWLSDNETYKFVIKDANLTLIGTYDNLVGINSNFVNYTNSQEIQTATAGQTVFNLTTMAYQPGTNSLAVFVDGVNQYGPGAQYAFTETSSTSVTFANGLHLGASVKFTTSVLNNVGGIDASQVTYDPPFLNSVVTNVEAKLAQTVSVKDFGAVGDGVSDDTAAIQYALNSGYGIYFPKGTYIITSQITIPSNSNITGEGPLSVIKRGASTTAPANNSFIINTNWAASGYSGDINITISDIAFDGNKANNTAWCNGLYIRASKQIYLNNVYAYNWGQSSPVGNGTGLVFSAVDIGEMNDCKAYSNDGDGMLLFSACLNVKLSGHAWYNGGIGFELEGRVGTDYTNYRNSNVLVSNCISTYNNDHGFLIDWSDDIVMSNCVSDYNQHNGVEILGCNRVVIDACAITNNGAGAAWAAALYVTSETYGATNASNSYITISNNVIDENNKDILIDTADHVLIINNQIKHITTSTEAIYLRSDVTGATYTTIAGNMFNIAGTCVRNDGQNYMTVESNDFYGSQGVLFPTAATYTGINVLNNRIHTTTGIKFFPSVVLSNSKIQNNQFISCTNDITGDSGSYTVLSSTFVSDNVYGSGVTYVNSVGALPTTGTWKVGDSIYNATPTAGGSIGWVCVTAGTPGTWKTFGAISA